MTPEDERIEKLIGGIRTGRLSRRELGRRTAGLGLSVPVGRALGVSVGTGAAVLPGLRSQTAARRASLQEGKGGVISVAQTGGDPGVGHPILIGGTDNYLFWWAFSRLVTYDDTGAPIPDLADSWTYNAGGTELTLKLNPNAKWHDGEAVTSADVLFTFDKVKDPNTKTDVASNLQVGGEFVTWAAPDPQTVVLTTKVPFAPFLFALSQVGIIPKHALEGSADINNDPFNRKPIGSGPFKIVEWEQDQFIRYERFDGYHRDLAAADGLNEVFFEDAQPALAAMEAGEIDITFTPPESQPPYEDNPDFVLHRYVYFTPITLSFNFKHPLLQDLKLRQAIRYAIDKDSLAETVTKGRNTRADNQYSDNGPLDRYNDYTLPSACYGLQEVKPSHARVPRH